MPGDAAAAMSDLLHSRSEYDRLPVQVTTESEDLAVAALDYGDDDHLFQVTVERVPRRRWAPARPLRIGDVDGVAVDLVGVTVDTLVHVRWTVASTEERDRLARDYRDAFEQWAATYRQTRAAPPSQPGQRLMQLSITIRDDLGTDYRLVVGQAGIDDDVCDARASFGPRPLAQVRALHMTIQAPGQTPVPVDLTW